MALVGLTSHYASAADGTLYFSGTIVNSTCKLASGNNDGLIEVKMGAVPLSKLKNDTNGTGPEVGVNISVKDCDEGTYYIVLTVHQPPRRLSLTYWLSMRVILQLKKSALS